MKAIKINILNKDAIEEALLKVNGRANSHTYCCYSQIEEIVKEANDELFVLIGNKSLMKGASITSLSGGCVYNSYSYSRKLTYVKLECCKYGDWRLVDASTGAHYGDGGTSKLHLTANQDIRAIEQFRKAYTH